MPDGTTKPRQATIKQYDEKVAVGLDALFRRAAPLRSRFDDLLNSSSGEAPGIFVKLIGDMPNMDIGMETLRQLSTASGQGVADEALRQAVTDARNATITINGRDVENWGYEGGIVLIVNPKLELLGYFVDDDPEVKSSVKSALAKMVATWFLDRFGPGPAGDITDTANIEYLDSIGVKVGFDRDKPHVYSGGLPPVMLNGQMAYIVGGHYYFIPEIRKELTGGTGIDAKGKNTEAGGAETALAYFTYSRLEPNPQKRTYSYEMLLRLLHDKSKIAILS